MVEHSEHPAKPDCYLGVHVGVTTTTVALADGSGTVVASRTTPSPREKPAAGIRAIRRLSSGVLADAERAWPQLRAAALAVPGLVDRSTGVLRIAPNLGWHDYPVEEALAEELGIPVRACNTTQAAAYAESRIGIAQDVRSFVWLYVGSGVGAAIVIGGQLFLGTRGFSGEIGHCRVVERGPQCGCGRVGCLEVVASGRAIANAAAAVASSPQPSALRGRRRLAAHDVVNAALGGDRACRRIITRAGRWLGRGISQLVDIVDPELIVVGGGVAQAGDLLLDPIRQVLNDDLLHADELPVVRSALLGQAEITGAVLLAREGAVLDRVPPIHKHGNIRETHGDPDTP